MIHRISVSITCSLVVSGVALTAYATAQCCKELFSWPNQSLPCSGSTAEVCEDGTAATENGRGWTSSTVDALCLTYELEPEESFYQGPCSFPPNPPEGAVKIGVLPNGNCCYIITATGFRNPESETFRGFKFIPCSTAPCGSGGGHH